MLFHNRQATSIENSQVRVTVLHEGGHVAEILHKPTGVNPLWIPPWRSMEPSAYDPARHPEYGLNSESRLLAGIMGHNLCLDIFGPPSAAEAEAGLTVHGEASVVRYDVESNRREMTLVATLPLAGLRVRRVLTLVEEEPVAQFSETVENLLSMDRAIGWTQHVTIGPPFLQNGKTRFWISASRSRVYGPPALPGSDLLPGAEFQWPEAPSASGGSVDLSVYSHRTPSAGYTAHLMDRQNPRAYFAAYSPRDQVLFGYLWRQEDFPWLGIWEENRSRTAPPWNGGTVTCGMEFGVSPFPETRRQMIERGELFGVPGYRWLEARQSATVSYSATVLQASNAEVEATVSRSFSSGGTD